MKADLLGCSLDLMTMNDTLAFAAERIEMGLSTHIITMNAEIVFQAQRDAALRTIINQADIVTPDGIGTVWGARFLGYPVRERVAGIDLMVRLCDLAAARGWKIYLLGAAPGVAQQAAGELARQFPGLQVCGYHDGYFTPAELPNIIAEIQQASPQILFAALGAPKQEHWIHKHRSDLERIPILMGIGGSLDVIAGHKKRAPSVFIKLNLEWLYRLMSEPSRIRRQLTLPRYVWLVLKQRFWSHPTSL